MTVHDRIRQLAQTPEGRAQLTRFCGEDFSEADWQRAFEHAGIHATERKVEWFDRHAPGLWTRRIGESLPDWEARKARAYTAADDAVLAELEACA